MTGTATTKAPAAAPAARASWQTQPPAVRIDVFPDTIFVTSFKTGAATTHPVAVADLIGALSNLPLSTGILPRSALFATRHAAGLMLAIYVPPGQHDATVRGRKTYHALPMPGFVFCGVGTKYWVFAVTEDPFANPNCALFHTPTPNVYPPGNVCPGDAVWPVCSHATIEAAFRIFMTDSAFNGSLATHKSKRHPSAVLDLWDEIEGQPAYPLDDLMPHTMTLQRLAGGQFHGSDLP